MKLFSKVSLNNKSNKQYIDKNLDKVTSGVCTRNVQDDKKEEVFHTVFTSLLQNVQRMEAGYVIKSIFESDNQSNIINKIITL